MPHKNIDAVYKNICNSNINFSHDTVKNMAV